MSYKILIKTAAVTTIGLALVVAIPLSGLVICGESRFPDKAAGLPVLLPLSEYTLFAIVPFLKNDRAALRLFYFVQAITFATGLIGFIVFPLYPDIIIATPFILLAMSVADPVRYRTYVLIGLIFAIIVNCLFLVWELDAGRSLPLVQFFQAELNCLPH